MQFTIERYCANHWAMDGEELNQLYYRRRAIDEARVAINLTKQRVESLSELLSRLRSAPRDQLGDVVYALLERCGDPRTDPQIAAELTRVSDFTDTLPSSERARFDGAVGRILRQLNPTCTLPLAMAWAEHRRKARRRVALQVLVKAPLTEDMAEFLLRRYRETRETDFLKVILREPLPQSLSVDELFGAFKVEHDDYWQARVAESALCANDNLGPELMRTQPHATIWAAGRLRMQHLIPEIVQALHRANDKVAILGVAVWALGKMGAKSELLALEPLIDELDAQYPDPWQKPLENRVST